MRWSPLNDIAVITSRMRFVILCFLLGIVFPVSAQYYAYNRYTTEHGLTQMQIHTLYKDVFGYLWVGTKDGINRFDGQRFTSYQQKMKLIHPLIINICGDKEGRVFFNSHNDIGYMYKDSFYRIPIAGIQTKPLHVVLYTDSEGRLWIHNSSMICRYDVQRNTLDTLLLHKDFNYNRIHTQFVEHDSYLLGIQHGNIIRIHKASMKLDTLGAVDQQVRFMIKSADPETFLMANSHTVYTWRLGSRKPIPCYHNPKVQIIQFFTDNYDKATILTSLNEVLYIDGSVNHFPRSLKMIDVILVDTTEHLIFAGTESGLGVVYQNGILTYDPQESSMPEGVWNIYEDKFNHIYFHSYNKGISRLVNDQLLDVSRLYVNEFNQGAQYQSYKDKNGDVYLNYRTGLVKQSGGKLELIPNTRNYGFFCMHFDTYINKLLLGCHNAVMQFDPSNNRLDTLVHIPLERPILSITRINAQWLLFTSGRGYYLYHPMQKKLSVFHYSDGKSPFRGSACSLRDSAGRIWIGTRDGLFMMDSSQFTLKRIDVVPDRSIGAIIQMNANYLLLGSGAELLLVHIPSVLKSKPQAVYRFNRLNGFNGIECRQNGFFQDSKGNIWIPTSTNVLCLLPSKLFADTTLKHAKIGYVYKGSAIDQWKTVATNRQVAFTYPNRNVKIEFRPGALLNTDKVRFRYRWNPNQAWSDWTTEHSVRFYDIPPGKYTFQVACEHQGYIEPGYDSFEFYIQPRWFEYFSVKILLIIASIVLLVSIWFLILSRKRNRESDIREKLAALELEILKHQLSPHFIRNTLKSVQSRILSMDENERFEAADMISALSRLFSLYLEASVNKFITLRDEINLLRLYLDFQVMRFKNKFSYEIRKDKSLSDNLKLTPMIIQPFVENATEKAFSGMEEKGHIIISFEDTQRETFSVHIQDNGIGRIQAESYRGAHTSNSGKIIDKMKSLYAQTTPKRHGPPKGQFMNYSITDLYDNDHNAAGTLVTVSFLKTQI